MGGPARHFRLNKARPGRPILRRHQTASFATNGASIQKISALGNKNSNESILLTFWQITLSWMSDELVVQLCIQRKEVFTKSSGTPEIWDNTEKFRFYLWPRPSTLLKIRSTDSLAWWYGLSLWIVTASCFSNLKRKNKLYILGYDFRLNMDCVLLGNAVYKTHRHSCKSNVRSFAKCQLKCLWGFLNRGVSVLYHWIVSWGGVKCPSPPVSDPALGGWVDERRWEEDQDKSGSRKEGIDWIWS